MVLYHKKKGKTIKKSFILYLTLLFVIIMLFLLTQILNIQKNNFNIAQRNIILKELNNLLKNTNDFNSSEDFKKIMLPFTLNYDNFKLDINISTLNSKVNLNLIKSKKKYIVNFLNNILYYYNVINPVYFINLILDSYDNDLDERDYKSEIALYNRKFINGEIVSFKQFNLILNEYYKYTNDNNIYKIPWKKLIYFSNQTTYIDCNLINKNVSKFLGLQFDKLTCKNIGNYEQNSEILKNLNIISYSKKENMLLVINTNYGKFIYSTKQKRIIKVEYNILY